MLMFLSIKCKATGTASDISVKGISAAREMQEFCIELQANDPELTFAINITSLGRINLSAGSKDTYRCM